MAVVPPRRGSAARTYNLLRHLSRRHEVVQFSLTWDEPPVLRPRIEESRVTPGYRELRYRHPVTGGANWVGKRAWIGAPVLSGLGLRLARPRELGRLLRWAEVVLVEFPWQFEACRRRGAGGRLVLASHNVESLKFPSWARSADARMPGPWLRYVGRAEARAARAAELVLAVSPEERDHYVNRYGVEADRVVDVPNGADTERFAPVDSETRAAARRRLGLPDRTTVLYAASAIPPNRRGAEWVRRVAETLDRFTFLAVGPGARVEGGPSNLVCPGFVDDVRPWFQAADLGLCPIEHGAGTKIKLLEYMAAGLPAVAFPAALRGLAARDGVEVVAAEPSVADLSAGLARLADDAELADRIRRAARQLVVERYDWARIAERLEAALTASRTTQASAEARAAEA
jgi:glycosyltransferase involved in cell wall biosynthesis